MPFVDIQKRREYQSKWGVQRRKKEKEKAFNLLGGKCVECGINDFRVLQIDHKKPLFRLFRTYSETNNRLRQTIASGKRTIEDLQLLCANCHQIKTYNDLFLRIKEGAINANSNIPNLQLGIDGA